MKTIIVLLFVFFTCSHICNAQFISSNDHLHFGAGALISASTYAVVYTTTKDKKKAFWYGLGASVLAGLAKEVLDGTEDNNKFDTGELVATSLGGLTASTTISLFTGKRKNKQLSFVPVE